MIDAYQPLHLESVEVVPVRVPLKRVFRGSKYSMDSRCTLITRIRTREGIVGEAYNGDEPETQAQIARIIVEELGPLLAGREIPAQAALWNALLPPTFDILRDRRLVIMAIAAVDSAAWDATGRALGVPLWRLWGGSRSSLPIIAIGGYYDEDIPTEMADYRRLGIAGCKFKVGGRTPEEDADRLRAARAAAGPDFVLMADANQAWTLAEAIRFGRLVEDLDVRWLEEPVRWANDRLDLAALRAKVPIPITAGQSETTASGARDLITSGAIDVCNFDASWGGGPSVWLRVAVCLASRRRGRRVLRRGDGPSRGAADRRAPPRRRPERHVPRVLPPGSRPDLLGDAGEPRRPGRWLLSALGGARPRPRARPGLHRPVAR
jgi:D-galactarolactone cycloisomerase